MRVRNKLPLAKLTMPKPEKSADTKVGEIDEGDLFEVNKASKAEANAKASHFKDVSEQLLSDHANRPRTRVILQIVARVLGHKVARGLSNVIAYLTGRVWLEARRNYGCLPPETLLKNKDGEALVVDGKPMTARDLAQRHLPRIYTINEDQSIDDNLKATEIRWEVYSPVPGKNDYSIVYYVRRQSEHMPIPVLGYLLDLMRPLFFSTRSRWNAIEIDVDRNRGEPVAIKYESSNYTGDPFSYEITSASDLHLPARVVNTDGQWTHTLHQKDNRAKKHDIENPFEGSTRPEFAFVNWNGSLDLVKSAKLLGYDVKVAGTQKKALFEMADLSSDFLGIQTYQSEAIDLQGNDWLKRRQDGRCLLYFPPRKDPSQFRVVNLISEELPSLIAQVQPEGNAA